MLTDCLKLLLFLAAFQNISCSSLNQCLPYAPVSFLCRKKAVVALQNNAIDTHAHLYPYPKKSSVGQCEVACEYSTLSLSCGAQEIINIMEADYGRSDQTTCHSYPDFFKTCSSADDTYHRVRERCHRKHSCNINASNDEFGDPCPYFVKYLKVKYNCESVDPKSTKSIILCENQSKIIECPKGTSLIVTDAFYGRQDNKSCSKEKTKDTDCFAKNTLEIVSSRCDYNERCTLQAKNSWFGDPCPGTYKYLEIDYHCYSDKIRRSRSCEQETTKIDCGIYSFIDIIEAYYGRSHPFICRTSSQPLLSRECTSVNKTTEVKGRCQGKMQCTISASNELFGDPCPGHPKYLDISYVCKDVHTISNALDSKIVEMSPGAPFIVTLTENCVTFYIDGMKKNLYNSYKVQIKNAFDDQWFDVFDGNSFDFSKDQTIGGLEPGRTYDIRIILRNFDCKDSCIPFTRFLTKVKY